ncbi:hypothetical protein CEH05_14685 [Halobacillus halophilus]|uniref:Uncharacterized protein n=1 Tax=Halobacillus halophilus (strain ATCC 35676 / DSM 2266 / JCM 20832 / KCTC 3685 / LMG 17431 / NBRC 102448 / NCIMB 2269) TaxID=866895 RepID=I0JQ86_HALH3|nr:hypothetical protein CEH05_14685 [Halobacillus halophilus]CCG46306.1 hypothetical protein HBHAL_3964 [Halobacillus halophilus DSM 2266]
MRPVFAFHSFFIWIENDLQEIPSFSISFHTFTPRLLIKLGNVDIHFWIKRQAVKVMNPLLS